jgi:hypothetical protein
VDKFSNKPLGLITILDAGKGNHFLALRSIQPLSWQGRRVLCSISRNTPNPHSLNALALAARQARANPPPQGNPAQNAAITRFAITGTRCGVWDYTNQRLTFCQHWGDSKQGSVSVGRSGLVILLGGSDSPQSRIDIEYYNCQNIVISSSYHDPAISFTLRCPPKFYEMIGEDVLSAALMSLTLGGRGTRRPTVHKNRRSSINEQHAKVAGTCFVYRIALSQYTMLSNVRALLDKSAKSTARIALVTPVILPSERIDRSFLRLAHDLTDSARYGSLPFGVLYQIDRLARNGVLYPEQVRQLLPKIHEIFKIYGTDAVCSALKRFYLQIPFAGPETSHEDLHIDQLKASLHELATGYERYKHNPENPYELVKRHQHINLIHKIVVTPAATYLEGPEPEPTNRVLRRYANDVDSFVRVVFQDEDRGSVRYDSRADQTAIFHEQFKGVLDSSPPILIAGKAFSFLGFSHSSLRAQSCWFMAPIVFEGTLRLPEYILKSLGDFEQIRVPAKCAARIGQNFTDTNATVDLLPESLSYMPAVTRNGYDFSDGCGTISEDLLKRVWRVYGTRRALKPTALQIRFQGCKGMVSLDSRLRGEQLRLRTNM